MTANHPTGKLASQALMTPKSHLKLNTRLIAPISAPLNRV